MIKNHCVAVGQSPRLRKEQNYKMKKSFAQAMELMSDEQAGKFIKGINDYVFEDKEFEPKDNLQNAVFGVVKVILDQEKTDKSFGKIGGKLSGKNRKGVNQIMLIAELEKKIFH